MEQVPLDRLVKLLNILSWNIKDGGNVIPIPQVRLEKKEIVQQIF